MKNINLEGTVPQIYFVRSEFLFYVKNGNHLVIYCNLIFFISSNNKKDLNEKSETRFPLNGSQL